MVANQVEIHTLPAKDDPFELPGCVATSPCDGSPVQAMEAGILVALFTRAGTRSARAVGLASQGDRDGQELPSIRLDLAAASKCLPPRKSATSAKASAMACADVISESRGFQR